MWCWEHSTAVYYLAITPQTELQGSSQAKPQHALSPKPAAGQQALHHCCRQPHLCGAGAVLGDDPQRAGGDTGGADGGEGVHQPLNDGVVQPRVGLRGGRAGGRVC